MKEKKTLDFGWNFLNTMPTFRAIASGVCGYAYQSVLYDAFHFKNTKKNSLGYTQGYRLNLNVEKNPVTLLVP